LEKSGLLKQTQIKLMVFNSVFEENNNIFHVQREGVQKCSVYRVYRAFVCGAATVEDTGQAVERAAGVVERSGSHLYFR